jgi:hypothetical protein
MHEAHWIDDVENGQCQVEDHGKQWQEGSAVVLTGVPSSFRRIDQLIGSPVRPRTLPP